MVTRLLATRALPWWSIPRCELFTVGVKGDLLES